MLKTGQNHFALTAIQEALNDNEKKAHERLAEAQKNLNILQRSTNDPFAGIITQRIINLAKNQVQAATQNIKNQIAAQKQYAQEQVAAQQKQKQKLLAEIQSAATKKAQDEADQKKANIKAEAEKMAKDSKNTAQARIDKIEEDLEEINWAPPATGKLVLDMRKNAKIYPKLAYDIEYANTLLTQNFPFASSDNKAKTQSLLDKNKEKYKQLDQLLKNLEQAIKELPAAIDEQIKKAGNEAAQKARKQYEIFDTAAQKTRGQEFGWFEVRGEKLKNIEDIDKVIEKYQYTYFFYSKYLAELEKEIKIQPSIMTSAQGSGIALKIEKYKNFIATYEEALKKATDLFNTLATDRTADQALIDTILALVDDFKKDNIDLTEMGVESAMV